MLAITSVSHEKRTRLQKAAAMKPFAAVASFLILTAAACFLANAAAEVAEAEEPAAYSLTADDLGQVLKTPDGRTVFRYMTKKPENSKLTANSVCCLFPLNTPKGVRVVDFAPSDHPHHRGVFLAWHAMAVGSGDASSRADFWGWGEMAPTEGRVIENRSVKLVSASAEEAKLAVRNDWMADGKKAIDERLDIAVREKGGAYIVDLTFRLTPTGTITLDQSAFGGFCIKARKDGTGTYTSPDGIVKLKAPHHLKPETDWPSAAWYDRTIKLKETPLKEIQTIGITIIDHPKNPATAWHNLASIAMINPCIVAPGKVTFSREKPLTLRYQLVVHDGPTPVELLKNLAP